jgi:2-octaprenylphenol hydroxylase
VAEAQCFDIAIIGAGIAGSALAAALSGNGLSIALVEAAPLVVTDLPPG